MLVGLAGALSGFNGSFDFPSGAVYPDHVPFRAMRVMLALPGVAMVPLAWGTAYELRFTEYAKHLVALMTLCGTCETSSSSQDNHNDGKSVTDGTLKSCTKIWPGW